MESNPPAAAGVPPADSDEFSHGDLVTVIVPARNEEGFIARSLDSILAQDEPNLQVVVVDGASTDRTAEIVRSYSIRDARVELIANPEGITPKSLNLAVAAARGVWLVRVDAHATVPPTYVRTAVSHLRSGRWGGVGGRKDGVGITPAGRAVAAAMSSRFGVGNSVYHYGSDVRTVEHIPFGAYPTALVRAMGGWDERCLVNQDFEFDYRVRERGQQLLFDPALSIDWHCRQSIRDLFRQYRRYGRGKTLVARLHPESIRLRHLTAPALLVWLGVAAILSVRKPLWSAAAVAPYAIGVGAASRIAARKLEDRAARLFVPAAFVAMHIGWGLGFWEGIGGALADSIRHPARRGRLASKASIHDQTPVDRPTDGEGEAEGGGGNAYRPNLEASGLVGRKPPQPETESNTGFTATLPPPSRTWP